MKLLLFRNLGNNIEQFSDFSLVRRLFCSTPSSILHALYKIFHLVVNKHSGTRFLQLPNRNFPLGHKTINCFFLSANFASATTGAHFILKLLHKVSNLDLKNQSHHNWINLLENFSASNFFVLLIKFSDERKSRISRRRMKMSRKIERSPERCGT